jgi:hypothetical protein
MVALELQKNSIIGIGSDEILAAEVRLATPSKVSPVTELLSCSTAGKV